MTDGPGFDPYEVLGVGVDADEIVVQLAYRARIRQVHPDIAGADGLARAKRLNVARDWLLDPELRSRLTRSSGLAPPPGGPARGGGRPARPAGSRAAGTQARTRSARRPGPSRFDPETFDFGPRTPELRSFLRAVGTLSRDERARVNYSLGEARPVHFEGYRDFVEPTLWARSGALRDAVAMAWSQGVDEEPPIVFPLGRVIPTGYLVANAYAQWLLLGGFLRHELGAATFRSEHFLDSFAARCVGPWMASIRQARYGPHDKRVRAFFATATSLPQASADRLARSWQEHMGRDGLGNPGGDIGPGVWLPAPPNVPEVLRVSGYLAAVDASRIEPPAGLDDEHQGSFRYGLRLTAHALALGLVDGAGGDYLRPWRDAVGPDPSLRGRLSRRMPAG